MTKKSIKSSLRKLETSNDHRLQVVRYYLDKHGIRVKEWYPHYSSMDDHPDPNQRYIIYFAHFESNSVSIPVPVDDYSFYLAMHEIGHIVTGDGYWSHKMEYKAEQWALAKCIKYGYYHKAFEKEAKEYVLYHMCNDVLLYGYNADKISQRMLDWVKMTPRKIRNRAIKYAQNIVHMEEEAPLLSAVLTI